MLRLAQRAGLSSLAPGRSRSCGLVGLPSVGKSTIFNALTQSSLAATGAYPFTTIDAQSAKIAVPDARLEVLAQLGQSARVVRTEIELTDIAGLIEGASRGAGMGNKFLADIRGVSVILHVVRCFHDEATIHVRSEEAHAGGGFALDPAADVAVIETELILADLASVEKRLEAGKRSMDAATALLADKCRRVLEKGLPARALLTEDAALREQVDSSRPSAEQKAWQSLQLLTQRPTVFVCNVGEDQLPPADADPYDPRCYGPEARKVADLAAQRSCGVVVICASLEAEAAALESEAEKKEFLQSCGVRAPGLAWVTAEATRALGLIQYFTVGPMEARAWTIRRGDSAREAAGRIHSDIADGFIRADTTSFDDFVACGGADAARAAGKTRSEGAEYIVQDGDVMLFRHK
jgi:GTP-binding protein YchF